MGKYWPIGVFAGSSLVIGIVWHTFGPVGLLIMYAFGILCIAAAARGVGA